MNLNLSPYTISDSKLKLEDYSIHHFKRNYFVCLLIASFWLCYALLRNQNTIDVRVGWLFVIETSLWRIILHWAKVMFQTSTLRIQFQIIDVLNMFLVLSIEKIYISIIDFIKQDKSFWTYFMLHVFTMSLWLLISMWKLVFILIMD